MKGKITKNNDIKRYEVFNNFNAKIDYLINRFKLNGKK